MDWYYAEQDEQKGPIDDATLAEYVTERQITADTLVWNEGMADWQPYGAVAAAAAAAVPEAEPGPEPDAALAPQSSAVVPRAVADVPAEVLPEGAAACQQCGRVYPTDEMLPYQSRYVCATCKETFFQRIQEGAGAIIGGGGTGLTPNAEIMADARAALAGRWGLGVGFNFLYQVLTTSVGMVPYVGGIAQLVLSGPFAMGASRFHVALIRRDPDANIGMMFEGFQRFGTTVAALLLQTLFVILWALLLIIPGILAAYSYMMTFYIIADTPEITAMDALRRSKEMMYGSRWKLFCLFWRFFGWSLLCILTLFIGFLWLVPYMNTSMAKFYEDVRGKAA